MLERLKNIAPIKRVRINLGEFAETQIAQIATSLEDGWTPLDAPVIHDSKTADLLLYQLPDVQATLIPHLQLDRPEETMWHLSQTVNQGAVYLGDFDLPSDRKFRLNNERKVTRFHFLLSPIKQMFLGAPVGEDVLDDTQQMPSVDILPAYSELYSYLNQPTDFISLPPTMGVAEHKRRVVAAGQGGWKIKPPGFTNRISRSGGNLGVTAVGPYAETPLVSIAYSPKYIYTYATRSDHPDDARASEEYKNLVDSQGYVPEGLAFTILGAIADRGVPRVEVDDLTRRSYQLMRKAQA